jgi:dTDP-4-dehydrorhamnose reductase
MKVLIYGGKGWIGSQFIDILNSNNIQFVISSLKLDFNSHDELLNELKLVNPTNVISFIGRTHGKIGDKYYSTIDYLEQEGKLVENLRDNLNGPQMLAQMCHDRGIHFTYLGTGCIFSYKEDDPNYKFTEKDDANFFGSSYSIVKGVTDKSFRTMYHGSLNLRIRMPITGDTNPRNFITKITTYEKICSIANSMTVLPELLPLIIDLMKMKILKT